MHDNQIVRVIDFLKPQNVEMKAIPFASTIFFELYFDSSPKCKEGSTDKSCYFLHLYYNEVLMKLPGCQFQACTFTEFESYFNTISFPKDKVALLCS